MPVIRQMLLETAKNAATGVPALRAWRLRRPRAGETFNGESAQLRRYAFQSLDIIRSSGVELAGRTVVEIGPGDFLTSGIAMLAAGASRYVSMDRFVGDYGRLEGKSWYTGIQVLGATLGEDVGVSVGAAVPGWPRPRPGGRGGALVFRLTV